MSAAAGFLLFAAGSLLLLASRAGSRAEPDPDARTAPVLAASAGTGTDTKPREMAAASAATSAAVAPAGPLVLARGVRIVHASSGEDAARVVRDAREHAKTDGRDLVVYVGAKWCQPCQVFHAAAQKGELDAQFPDLTLLEFDVDEDRERLATAGYVSQFIPLFALPGADGRASDRRFEGATKGANAAASIEPRLRSLLQK